MTTSGANAMRSGTVLLAESSRAGMAASVVIHHVVLPEQPTNA